MEEDEQEDFIEGDEDEDEDEEEEVRSGVPLLTAL